MNDDVRDPSEPIIIRTSPDQLYYLTIRNQLHRVIDLVNNIESVTITSGLTFRAKVADILTLIEENRQWLTKI